MSSEAKLFRFVQFEYAWPLGPEDGRYLLREHAGEDAHHVLVFESWPTTVGRGSKRWGREPPVQSAPTETGLSRATVVETSTVSEAEADEWLEKVAAEQAIDEGLDILNAALRTFRAAAADPYAREVGAGEALAVRAGYGAGVEVAEGAWTEARDLPRETGDRRARRKRASRNAALRSQERFAAVLGGRDAVLACEELALRARADVDAGRTREAALQTQAAVAAGLAELAAFRGQEPVARRLDELEGHADALARAASEALQGGLGAERVAEVVEGLELLESTLRARSASATY